MSRRTHTHTASLLVREPLKGFPSLLWMGPRGVCLARLQRVSISSLIKHTGKKNQHLLRVKSCFFLRCNRESNNRELQSLQGGSALGFIKVTPSVVTNYFFFMRFLSPEFISRAAHVQTHFRAPTRHPSNPQPQTKKALSLLHFDWLIR